MLPANATSGIRLLFAAIARTVPLCTDRTLAMQTQLLVGKVRSALELDVERHIQPLSSCEIRAALGLVDSSVAMKEDRDPRPERTHSNSANILSGGMSTTSVPAPHPCCAARRLRHGRRPRRHRNDTAGNRTATVLHMYPRPAEVFGGARVSAPPWCGAEPSAEIED